MFERHQVLRRLKLNLGAHSFGYLINILNQLALLPVYLHYWPKAVYGEWLVLTALPVYVEMADFGLATITTNRMCMATARGDEESARRTFQTTWSFQVVVLALAFILLNLAIWAGNPSEWLSIHQIPSSETRVALFLLIIRSIIPVQLRLNTAIYSSHFQAARGTFLQNMTRVVELILIIVMIVTGHGVVGVALAMLAAYVGGLLWMHMDSHRVCPDYTVGWTHFSKSELRECLRDGLAFQLMPTSGMFLMQGMTIVVNYVLGPAAVVIYNVTRVVCRVSLVGIQMTGWAIRPELALLYGRGDWRQMKSIFLLLMRVTFWVSILACILVCVFGRWGIALLTHGKMDVSGWFLWLFALTMVTSAFWSGASVLLISANLHRRFALIMFTVTVLLLPLSSVLMLYWGLLGAAIALLLVDAIICTNAWRECQHVFAGHAPLSLSEVISVPDKAFISELSGLVLGRGHRPVKNE